MKNDIAESTEILFDLVSTLEPRLAPLEDWFKQLCHTIDVWYMSEGTQGIKRAKDILTQGWLSILGEGTETLNFVKSSHGIPELVLPLVSRVKPLLGYNGHRLLSGTLSLIRVTDLWLGIPTDKVIGNQIEVIQNSSLPKSAHKIIDEFSRFIELFVTSFPEHPVVKAYRKTLTIKDHNTYLYRESYGPNGRLTANAHKDVKTLMEAKTTNGGNLLDSIIKLQQDILDCIPGSGFGVSTRFPREVLRSDSYDTLQVSSCPGKLNFIAEKSGKVRIIAQPDYFSQLSLRPIHDWCFSVLRQFPADCTFDQRSAVPKICRWQSEGCYTASFDQSSCTDLFPFDMQLSILNHRFGEALTESVKTVMSDRDWTIRFPSKTTKKIRWSVGQPMGMMLSWPLMALTHHFLVQFASWKSSGGSFSRKGPFNDYVICGDDIVIASKSVADCYRKIVLSLGMKINMSKSHISGGDTNVPSVSEFAKITIWKGRPLFPVRPKMVLSAVRDWRQAVPLLIDLANVEGFDARQKHIERWVKRRFPKGRRFLIPLLTIPRYLGGVGYRDSVSMKKKFSLIHTGQVHPYIVFLANKIRSGLVLETRSIVTEELQDLVGESYYRCHPLVEYGHMVEQQLVYSGELYNRRTETIPSVRQIVKTLLADGIRPYERFLHTNEQQKVYPFWDNSVEQERMRDRTLWEKSLGSDLTLHPVELESVTTVQPSSGMFLSSHWSKVLQDFANRQYNILYSVWTSVDQSR